jgi:hypothetical protein
MHDDTPAPLPQTPRRPRDDLASPTGAPAVEAGEKVEETSIDHGVEESFPASDPVSVSITKVIAPAP